MKKTLLALVLAAMLAFSLVSCSDGSIDYATVNLVDEGYVTLGDYKNFGIDLEMFVTAPDEADIISHLSHVSDKLVELESAAADGDIVDIDFVGTMNGVEFEGGSAEGTLLRLGSDTMIDGFEDGIVGMAKGEVKTIDVTFPEDYGNAELKGKDAKFEITLNAVYDSAILTDPEVLAHVQEETDDTSAVWSVIQSFVTVNKYPEKYVKNVANTIYKNYEYTYRMYGMMENMSVYGITDEYCEKEAKASVDSEFAVYAFVQAENLTYTEEEFDAMAEELAASYGYTDAAQFKKAVDKKVIETEVYREKVIERLTALSKESVARGEQERAEAEETTAAETTAAVVTEEVAPETTAAETTAAVTETTVEETVAQ
ncbi:MAG: hypothetical protein E7598_00350 [Ruminococcaceae bacterium]|nr:hypothetical protein [Oscillospiraceae bacterium]